LFFFPGVREVNSAIIIAFLVRALLTINEVD
jgi:hypothetical protein